MSTQPLQLPGSCDVRDVAALHARFVEALSSADEVRVDATAVEHCDTAVVQLLFAVAREPRVTWRLSAALRARFTALALPIPKAEEAHS